MNQVPVTQHVATSASDDYYQTVVITSLLAILKDQALSSHHHTVIEAIMSIFKTQGLKCVTFLPQVIILLSGLFITHIADVDHSRICFCDERVHGQVARIPSTAARHLDWDHQAAYPQLHARCIQPDYRALGERHATASYRFTDRSHWKSIGRGIQAILALGSSPHI